MFVENAVKILEKRYLKKDEKGNVIETPDELLHRVADYIAGVEKGYNANVNVKALGNKFYKVMKNLDFLPNSPTLMNAGKGGLEILSACFVMGIEDSMESIFETAKRSALIFKSGGGCISAGSTVVTSCGRKKIEDVEVGDKVFGVNEDTHEWGLNEVIQTHKYSPKDKNIVKVSFNHKTESVVTDWHPFGVLREEGISWVRADELKKDDLVISGANQKFKLDDYFWVLGLVASDGSFSKKHLNSKGFRINDRLRLVKSYEEVVSRMARILKINYHKESARKYNADVWGISTTRKSILEKMREYYYDDRVGWKKADNMRIPKQVFSASYSKRVSYIVGLLDGDGTYDKSKGRFVYDTTSKEFGEDLLSLLATVGIESNYRIRTYKQENWHDIFEVYFKCLYGLPQEMVKASARYFVKDMNFKTFDSVFLPTKYRDYLGFNTTTVKTKQNVFGEDIFLSQWYNFGNLAKASANHIVQNLDPSSDWGRYLLGTKKVVSVTPTEAVDLYDLTVKDSKTYLASTKGSPVVIHNTGYNFSSIREKGAIVKTTGGVASGPISFMEAYNAITETVKQASRRRGAAIALLDISHPDIEDFIVCKKEEGVLSNFNISVSITNKFMEAVKMRRDWDLISPSSGKVVKTVKARDLFDKLVHNAWANGEPGIIFIDRINEDNPTPSLGRITTVNPCLSGKARILTVDGFVPLEDTVSDNVKIINKDGGVSTSKIWCSGKRKTMDILFEGGTVLSATPEHSFMLEDGSTCCASDLKGKQVRKYDFGSSKVVDVTEGKVIDVYDFTEPISNWGVIEGLIVHNCGEEPLLIDPETGAGEACNLGSINLSNFVSNGAVDYSRLSEVVKTAVHFLDNVIDAGGYIFPEIEAMVKRTRKIGLGVMGFADLLFQMKIPYNSDEAIVIAQEIMKHIKTVSHGESMYWATKKEPFPAWKDSVFAEKGMPMRNAAVTTVAPTGTISMLADCSGGIEPVFNLVYTKIAMDNTRFKTVNKWFLKAMDDCGVSVDDNLIERIEIDGSVQDIDEVPEEIKKVFVTTKDIAVKWHVALQSAFQGYVDASISKTVNLPNEATQEDVKDAFILAHGLNCKGVTIYRDGSREKQVLNNKKKVNNMTSLPVLRQRPLVTKGITHRVETGVGKLYVTLNQDDIGPCEVFCNIGKSGSQNHSYTEAMGRLISLALRSNIPPKLIIDELLGIAGTSISWDNGEKILSVPDAIGKVLNRHINGTFHNIPKLKKFDNYIDDNDSLCPNCGSQLRHVEGCVSCSCGYSRC